ncbi:MAG: hypothetical protein OXB95_01600 [Rhodobacteraceae bacterium]|nr:hypothetical protein [Paracoccaceae bacterium]
MQFDRSIVKDFSPEIFGHAGLVRLIDEMTSARLPMVKQLADLSLSASPVNEPLICDPCDWIKATLEARSRHPNSLNIVPLRCTFKPTTA